MLTNWIFIPMNRPLYQILGYLQQNALQYAAKHSAFWC